MWYTIFSFLLLLSVSNADVYPCDCMNIDVSYDPANEETCTDRVFTYVFNNTEECKEISNVVFDELNDFSLIDTSCVKEVDSHHSPFCNKTFDRPWKFDFGDCFVLTFTVPDTFVVLGEIQYKAGTECFHCEVPVPKSCHYKCENEEDTSDSTNLNSSGSTLESAIIKLYKTILNL